MTVYHMLECHAMDILPYSGATTTLPPDADDGSDVPGDAKARKTLLHVGDIADWCIFSIEVRNTYGLPFEVTFERNQEGPWHLLCGMTCPNPVAGAEHASITTLVPPGSTSR